MRQILLFIATVLLCCNTSTGEVRTGAERIGEWQQSLQGQRIALLANHTSMVGDVHLLDTLLSLGHRVVGVASPEHGFRGTADAGEKVASGVDARTSTPIWSLYSAKNRRLTEEQIAAFDVMIIDMQDVGLRFYTYYITMIRTIEQCGKFGKKVIILDRPNPNGMYVDGPILRREYYSGVGALPIPVVHGMTLGELARMAMGEGWICKADMQIIPCTGYTHRTRYRLPIAPSPNLRTQHAIYLYPSTCLFEGTVCSLGRGTDSPFEIYGHPAMKGCTFSFTPRSVAGAKNPPLKDVECFGVDLRNREDDEIIANGFDLQYVIDAYRRTALGEAFFTPFFEKLVGVPYIRQMIIEGRSSADIRSRYAEEVEQFRQSRRKYLLYEE